MAFMRNPSHPGPVVRELWMEDLAEVEVSALLNVPSPELAPFLNGESRVSPKLARKLEAAGWPTAEFWMRLQAAYDLAQERTREEAVESAPDLRRSRTDSNARTASHSLVPADEQCCWCLGRQSLDSGPVAITRRRPTRVRTHSESLVQVSPLSPSSSS